MPESVAEPSSESPNHKPENHVSALHSTVDPAPAGALTDFSAPMTGGKTFRLDDFRGRNLILYFYPKDDTPGCTAEGLRFRDLYPEFQAHNTDIFGVSRDSLASHERFKAKLEMPFELISDPDEEVCRQFGVMKSKMMYGKQVRGIERSTFAIDAAGRLVKEWRGIKVPGHVDDVLDFVKTFE